MIWGQVVLRWRCGVSPVEPARCKYVVRGMRTRKRMRRDSKRLCLLRDGNLLAAAMGRCIAAGSVLEHILPRYINVAIVWHISER